MTELLSINNLVLLSIFIFTTSIFVFNVGTRKLLYSLSLTFLYIIVLSILSVLVVILNLYMVNKLVISIILLLCSLLYVYKIYNQLKYQHTIYPSKSTYALALSLYSALPKVDEIEIGFNGEIDFVWKMKEANVYLTLGERDNNNKLRAIWYKTNGSPILEDVVDMNYKNIIDFSHNYFDEDMYTQT